METFLMFCVCVMTGALAIIIVCIALSVVGDFFRD